MVSNSKKYGSLSSDRLPFLTYVMYNQDETDIIHERTEGVYNDGL